MNWITIYGSFQAGADSLTFLGREMPAVVPTTPGALAETPATFPLYGVAICDQTFSDGRLAADITFSAVDQQTSCELMVAWDASSRSELSAGIGGATWSMFEIRGWTPGSQEQQARFRNYYVGGSRDTLQANRSYHLEAAVVGSRINLWIDGVEVATTVLPEPLPQRRQVGMWCASRANILIANFTVRTEKPRAFVVMEFGASFDELYSEVIRSICGEYQVEVVRVDEMYGPGLIIGDIVKQIARAQLVIADVTPKNPNVYFEVGYALAMQKPMILLAKKGTALPFDVAPFRVLFYEDSIGGKSRVEEGLRKHVAAILEGR